MQHWIVSTRTLGTFVLGLENQEDKGDSLFSPNFGHKLEQHIKRSKLQSGTKSCWTGLQCRVLSTIQSILVTICQRNKSNFQLQFQSDCTSKNVVTYNLGICNLENDKVDETKLHTTKSLVKCNLSKLHLKWNFILKLQRVCLSKYVHESKF